PRSRSSRVRNDTLRSTSLVLGPWFSGPSSVRWPLVRCGPWTRDGPRPKHEGPGTDGYTELQTLASDDFWCVVCPPLLRAFVRPWGAAWHARQLRLELERGSGSLRGIFLEARHEKRFELLRYDQFRSLRGRQRWR